MKRQSILTASQKLLLKLFADNKPLSIKFYLTGGTAIVAYYIPYRYSEDLDFFSEKEVDTSEIAVFLRSVKDKLGYQTFDLNTSYNRNIFLFSDLASTPERTCGEHGRTNRRGRGDERRPATGGEKSEKTDTLQLAAERTSLNFKGSVLKAEFTYFPFPQIEKPKVKEGIKIDGVIDIAVNKLFTIYQKPRSRDFMDLYMINQKYNFSMDDLLKEAKVKFDWHIDKLKLGAQFLLSEELKDYPKLIEPLDEELWQGYFKEEAKRLGKAIIE